MATKKIKVSLTNHALERIKNKRFAMVHPHGEDGAALSATLVLTEEEVFTASEMKAMPKEVSDIIVQIVPNEVRADIVREYFKTIAAKHGITL